MMNITKHLAYLETFVKTADVDRIITDDVFCDFVYCVETYDYVVVNESYLYVCTAIVPIEYTFEGMDDLFDGLLHNVSNDDAYNERKTFLRIIDECIRVYHLCTEMKTTHLLR